MKKSGVNLILMLSSLAIAVIVGERLLNVFFPAIEGQFMFRPHLKESFSLDREKFPGIEGVSNFITNSIGIRSDEPPENTQLKVVVLGGSTTECTFLDQDEIWTQILQDSLNGSWGPVWVANLGKSGLHTDHHLFQIDYISTQPELANPDIVILLSGVNDFNHFLIDSCDYLNPKVERIHEKVLPYYSDASRPFYKRNAYWRALEVSWKKHTYAQRMTILDVHGEKVVEWRRKRQNAVFIKDTLPKLDRALAKYRKNLTQIIEKVRLNGASIIMITQPVMWSENLDDFHQNLLWMGGLGRYQIEASRHTYYSPKALEQGMLVFNNTMVDVAQTNDTYCVQLHEALPADTNAFYDDCHFNESGSLLVVKEVLKIARTKMMEESQISLPSKISNSQESEQRCSSRNRTQQ